MSQGTKSWRCSGHASLLMRLMGLLLVIALATACTTEAGSQHRGDQSWIPRLGIRPTRAAVPIPATSDPLLVYGYARLEARTNHLLRQELGSHVVERKALAPIRAEQRWQYHEPAAEATTARLGRLSGADTLILFHIIIPTLRERVFAREGIPLSPVTIIGRVVTVETGELVWDHVVTVEVGLADRWRGGSIGYDPAVRRALDRGVKEMEAAFAQPVTCENRDCVTEAVNAP